MRTTTRRLFEGLGEKYTDMPWSSTTTHDMLIQLDSVPLVVRVSAIAAMEPTQTGKTCIYLASGHSVVTETSVDDVMAKLQDAQRRTTPTFGGSA